MSFRWSFCLLAASLMLGCGDDGGGDETTVSNDDSCQSICGCDGCPDSATSVGPGGTSQASDSTGSASGSGDGTTTNSTTMTTSPATDGGQTDGGQTDTGTAACVCDPTDPKLAPCPDRAGCQTPGAECCTAEGTVDVCVENDIGVVWLSQTDC